MNYTNADYVDFLVTVYAEGMGEARNYCEQNGLSLAGKIEPVLAWLNSRANQGDTRANHALGEFLAYGVGVPVNDERALVHARAAEALPAALLLRYHLLVRGEQSDAERDEALVSLENAASMNYPPAVRTLSSLYEMGQTVEIDHFKAASLLKRAADLGDAHSMFVLGTALLAGDDPAQRKQGLRYVEAAAEKDFEGAVAELAAYHRRGLHGLPKDERTADRLAERAALLGQSLSRYLEHKG